jgi:hypothetical protein
VGQGKVNDEEGLYGRASAVSAEDGPLMGLLHFAAWFWSNYIFSADGHAHAAAESDPI